MKCFYVIDLIFLFLLDDYVNEKIKSHEFLFIQLPGLNGYLKDVLPHVVKVYTNTLEFVLELVNAQKEKILNLNLVKIFQFVVSL